MFRGASNGRAGFSAPLASTPSQIRAPRPRAHGIVMDIMSCRAAPP